VVAAETVAELVALRARIDAQLFAVLADADRADVAAEAGAINTAAWLRGITGLTGAEATRLVRQAVALEGHDPTRDAWLVGTMALCELLERYPVNRLPTSGGVTATVVVTIPLETLEGRLQVCRHSLLGQS